MFIKRSILTILATILGISTFAINSNVLIGIVNSNTCISESKYGKFEQDQLEKIKKQWTSLIEETEKELKSINKKLEDQDYVDGLSPAAEEELTLKKQTLEKDLVNYHKQLYQVFDQAKYFFFQKMFTNIAKAAEEIAKQKKLDLVMNKEACFYHNPKMEITDLIVKEMDKNFEKNKKISENKEEKVEKAEK